jgi:hypothetical protein
VEPEEDEDQEQGLTGETEVKKALDESDESLENKDQDEDDEEEEDDNEDEEQGKLDLKKIKHKNRNASKSLLKQTRNFILASILILVGLISTGKICLDSRTIWKWI